MTTTWHNLFQRLQELDQAPGGTGAIRQGAAPLADFFGKFLLLPLAGSLSLLYGLGARTRRQLYAQGWLKTKRLPAPVISLGNLTVGGTGKTPMAACLARLFQGQGKQVVILSRGYGGTAKNVTRISDGRQIYEKPPKVGEEAYWLARALPGVGVYTAPSRYAAGLAAWREIKPDLFLLDDGFQHFQLHRDLDVVLLDAESPFGNGYLLPRGPLREPIATLETAQVLVLTRFRADQHQDRLAFLQGKFPGKPVLTADIGSTGARIYPEGREIPLASLNQQKLLACAGLARPRVFYDSLRDLGVNLLACRDFPDHYAFKAQDLESLVKEAQSLGAAGIITTVKDWARLGEKWELPLPLYVLEVAARLEGGVEERIVKILRERSGRDNRFLPSETGLLSPPFPKGDLGRFSGVPKIPPIPPLEKGGNESLIPLPPEVKQRFGELRVRGKGHADPDKVRRLLVRAPNWVGDAVMSLPTLAGVHTLFPQAEITVLAAPRVAPLFAGIPGVSYVVVYPTNRGKWRTLWHLRHSKAFLQLTENRKQKTENLLFDLGLALPNSWEAALGLWLAGARIRLGYATQGRRPLLNVAVTGSQSLSGLHTVYYLLGVLQGLGGVDFFVGPRLYLREEEVQDAAALLKDSQGDGPWVGLSPGAAFGPAKRWPPERFAALGQELQKEFGARLVLLGGPEDREAAAAVKTRLPGVLNLVGRTTLRQALGVLTRLSLLITNDSGLMHAAAALGTPLVALFGSTDPVATGPFTDRATVLHHPLPCSPCFKRTCDRDYQCLLDISVPEVLDAAKGWLKE
ncbi:MAG: lipopolysaccharide heptosyltransferase II [Syntrophales bacterium]|nr:lipopolysaccharide heptosyltransferase II [Syntrophales bacterium]